MQRFVSLHPFPWMAMRRHCRSLNDGEAVKRLMQLDDGEVVKRLMQLDDGEAVKRLMQLDDGQAVNWQGRLMQKLLPFSHQASQRWQLQARRQAST